MKRKRGDYSQSGTWRKVAEHRRQPQNHAKSRKQRSLADPKRSSRAVSFQEPDCCVNLLASAAPPLTVLHLSLQTQKSSRMPSWIVRADVDVEVIRPTEAGTLMLLPGLPKLA
jgi:hypothetical protein